MTASPPSGTGSGASRNSSALDQWRGLALILVLFSHGFFFTDRLHGIGRVGVNLFFFISGILVYRSLTSANNHGAFDFWKRRIMRLLPALVVYLMGITLLVWLVPAHPHQPDDTSFPRFLRILPYAATFSVNFVVPPISLGHLWSVAVEMQFYLLAPLILLLGIYTNRMVAWGAVLALLMAVGFTEVLRSMSEKYEFQATVWPMMLGFFAEYRRVWLSKLPNWISLLLWFSAACVGLSFVLMLAGAGKIMVIALGCMIFVLCFISYATNRTMPGRTGLVLEWLGQRTYSTYLWQEPLTLCGFIPAILTPIGAVFSIAVGAVSYHFFEKPFLSAKRQKAVTHAAQALPKPAEA